MIRQLCLATPPSSMKVNENEMFSPSIFQNFLFVIYSELFHLSASVVLLWCHMEIQIIVARSTKGQYMLS